MLCPTYFVKKLSRASALAPQAKIGKGTVQHLFVHNLTFIFIYYQTINIIHSSLFISTFPRCSCSQPRKFSKLVVWQHHFLFIGKVPIWSLLFNFGLYCDNFTSQMMFTFCKILFLHSDKKTNSFHHFNNQQKMRFSSPSDCCQFPPLWSCCPCLLSLMIIPHKGMLMRV